MHWLIMQRGNGATFICRALSRLGYHPVININVINRADAKSITKEKNRKEKEMEFHNFATKTMDILDLEVKTAQPISH